MGGVFFDTATRTMQFVEDVPDQRPFLQAQKLLSGFRPNKILTKSKGNQDFMKFLQDHSKRLSNASSDETPAIEIQELSSKMFNFEIAKKRLLSIKTPGMSRSAEDAEEEVRVVLNVSCTTSIIIIVAGFGIRIRSIIDIIDGGG